MRYRVGEDPATAALNSTDHTLIITVVMSLFIGIALVWLGHRGRQFWLTSWSYGLIVCSVLYGGWMIYHGMR
ncbi:MAG: hypothetical protein KDK91_04615 [Gammaproteobacteria bacterium]|nr:hypothetical protein [Gammaproteobacteria bacterium]